MTKCGWC